MCKLRIVVLALASVLAAGSAAAESGKVLKADELKAEPFRDAKAVARLTAGDKVEIIKRQGGWYQIKAGKTSGWVRMLSVRRGETSVSGKGDATGLLGLASGRAGTGKVVSTTGIRGLNEEELKAAKFSESELKLSDSYVESAESARKFAAKGKLTARKMDYLPNPAE